MSETDLDTQPAAPAAETEAKQETPWESMDPDEPAEAAPAAPPVVRVSLSEKTPQAAKAAEKSSPFASTAIVAAGAEMAELASELKSLVAKDHFSPFETMIAAPQETSEDHLLAKAFLSDEKVESFEQSLPIPISAPPVTPSLSPEYNAEAEPAAIDHTPWATIHEEPVESISAAPVIDLIESANPPQAESHIIEEQASTEPVEAIDESKVEATIETADKITDKITVEPLVESDPVSSTDDAADPDSAQPAIEEAPGAEAPATTFAPTAETIAITMTAPVEADDLAAAAVVAPVERELAENPGDEPVLVLDTDPAEVVATGHETVVQPQVAAEAQLQTVTAPAPTRVATGGGWTIPIMCLGIGLIACCLSIPQMDFNRRLRYEQENLRANLQAVEKQVAVNDEFLKKVMDDPTLAERLAGRQMKTMRKGQKVVEIKDISDDGDMSPFALVAVAPPAALPPYSPIKGTIANICNNSQSRLYLLGAAMTMVAVGLVMGSSAKA